MSKLGLFLPRKIVHAQHPDMTIETFASFPVASEHTNMTGKLSDYFPRETGVKGSHKYLSNKGMLKFLCSIPLLICVPLMSISPALAGILSVGERLDRGDQGPKVGTIQRQLRELGFYDGPISEFYGELTEAAVANYQQSINLPVDGIFGAQTDNALFDLGLVGTARAITTQATSSPITRTYALGERVLEFGDQGPDVRAAQALLDRFAPLTVDGEFGPQTDTLVRNFQLQYGLNPDGKIGPDTLAALNNLGTLTPLASSGTISRTSRRNTVTRSSTDIGRSPEATQATIRANQINGGPYTVVIPANSEDTEKLRRVRQDVGLSQACMASSRRGSYIFAGGYPEYSNAETAQLTLQANRPDLSTPRLNPRIDYRGGDFTVECLY